MNEFASNSHAGGERVYISIHDVAAFFLNSCSEDGLSSMALHKLCFLADVQFSREHPDSRPLFPEYFTHTVTGPRYADLLPHHTGQLIIHRWDLGYPETIHTLLQDYLTAVWNQYSALTGPMLSDLTMGMPEYRHTDTTSPVVRH